MSISPLNAVWAFAGAARGLEAVVRCMDMVRQTCGLSVEYRTSSMYGCPKTYKGFAAAASGWQYRYKRALPFAPMAQRARCQGQVNASASTQGARVVLNAV